MNFSKISEILGEGQGGRIFKKIFGLAIFTALVAGVVVLTIAVVKQTNSAEESLVRENKVLARAVAKSIESGYLGELWPFGTLGKISESEEILFWWIVKPNGEIFLASDSKMEGKEVDISASREKTTVEERHYKDQRIKLISEPLRIEVKQLPWHFSLGISLKSVEVTRRKTIFASLGYLLLTIFLVIPISYYFSKGVTKPLKRLEKGTEIIRKGNLDHRIKIETKDEIERLANSFNEMVGELQESRERLKEAKKVLKIRVRARTKELRQLNQELEERVEKRTQELQERVDELERFHRLTVGRETRMIELKDKIKELKEKVKKLKQQDED